MPEMVVGLDMHLKRTQGTLMSVDGKIVRQEKFETNGEELKRFLAGVPAGTKVALESQGFCWPWVDFIEELGYFPLLANPIKVKARAEDVKTDKVDSELLANLARMDWLPTCYVPEKEMRWLRNLLRHRAFRRKISTALKNRTWSEFRKRGYIVLKTNLGTLEGRRNADSVGIYEVSQNIEILEVVESQMKQIESGLVKRYGDVKPVKLIQSIPGFGFLTALTLYAEICDIKRFPNPDKLAHYAGLVPRVKQTAGHTRMGKEIRANRWLKWALIEAAWSHINWRPEGRLAKVFENAYRRKRDKKKSIKIVARKLVNIVWAVWTYEKEFTMDKV